MNKFNRITAKITTLEQLEQARKKWKLEGKKVVFTNGCFDLIHAGHIDYLARAADLGDVLVIGLNSDKSVKNIKGPERPVNDEKTRSLVLAAFEFTDAIILFDEDTPASLISKILPDILVKGGDYREEEIAGAGVTKQSGGKVIILPFVEGYSSTSVIEKIKKNNS